MNDMIPPEDLGVPIDEVVNEEVTTDLSIDEEVLGTQTPEDSFATASDRDLQDTSLISWGEDYMDPKSTKNKVVAGDNMSMLGIIESFRNTGVEPDINKVQATAEQQQQMFDDMLDNPDFVYEQVAAVMGKDANPTDVRAATNLEIARRIVADLRKREESESTVGGIVDAVVDFGAMILRESTVGIPENLGSRTETKGIEIGLKRFQMSPKEFKAWFNDYAESVYEEGLGSGNAWQIDQLEEELEGMGVDRLDTFKAVFALADIAGLKGAAVATKGITKSIAKSPSRISEAMMTKRTKVGKVAVVEGVETATEKGVARAKAGDAEAISDTGPAINNPSGTVSSRMNATEGVAARDAQKNSLAKEIDRQASSGTLARVLNEDEIATAKAKFANNLDAKSANRLLYSNVVETGLGRFYHVARLGTNDNAPFKAKGANLAPPKAAENLASRLRDKGTPAEVVPVDVNDLSQGYIVEMKQNLKVGDTLGSNVVDLTIADKISRVGIGRALEAAGLGKLVSSSASRDVETIQALGFRGEQGLKVIKKIVEDHLKPIKKLSFLDKETINRVITKYRDGEHAARRTRYSDIEFDYEFKQLSGKDATQAHRDAYHAISDLEDTAWTLKANEVLMRYVNKGFKGVEVNDGIILPGKRVGDIDGIGSQVKIADINSGVDITKDRLGINDVIFKLDKPWVSHAGEQVEYITKPKRVTELEPEDVLGYNPGGTRLNEDANYFAVASAGNRSKVLFSTMTEKQVNIGIEEITNLLKAGDNLTDDMVQANNKWRPELETVQDFKAWLKEAKVDPKTDRVFRKERDQSITLDDGVVTDASPSLGGNFGDWLANDLRREDRVLDQFGGGKVLNTDPMTSIVRQLDGLLQEHSMRAYTLRSQVEWVKTALRKGKSDWFPTELAGSKDYYRMFMNATPKGTEEFSIRMKELQGTYKRRMGYQGPVSNYIDQIGSKLAEHVLDKTGIKTQNANLTNKMMAIGFQSAFGFLNVAQLFLQASHTATIIAASPVAGFKGSGLALTTRAILATTDTEVYGALRKNIAKAYDITEDQLEELLELQRSSGRADVDGDILENGTGTGIGWSKFNGESRLPSSMRKALNAASETTAKGLDAGLVFFNMGERMSARTSLYTAALEYMKKNPRASILSDEARSVIAKRDQDLSFAMSNHARSAVQSGLMKVPTQWLSHSMRSMETVFIGRGFTVAERARMATAMGPMLGLNGLGMTWAADNLNEYFGDVIPEDSAFYTTLKWGVYDGVMDALLPEGEGEGRVGIGFSSRMAPVSAFTDLYDKVFGDQTNVASAIAGPSGEITQSLVEAVFGALGSLQAGQPVSLTEDLIKVLRQPSALDSFAKAAGIITDGTYRSKNGVVIPGKMTSTEAVLQLLGVGSLKQQEWYDLRTQMFRVTKQQIAFRKELKSKISKAHELLYGPNADMESINKGTQLIKELQATIQYSNFPPEVQRSLRKSVFNGLTEDFPKMQDFLVRQERMQDLRRIESVIGR
jgi:hypothetical protein